MQHLKDYDYQERCSRQNIEEAVKAAKEESKNAKIAEQEVAKNIADGIAAEIMSTQQVRTEGC